MGDELVRVERFEELSTGMRVVRQCSICALRTHGLVGGLFQGNALAVRHSSGDIALDKFGGRILIFIGRSCCMPDHIPVITDRSIKERRIFRFASDLGIADVIAAEENPYLARTVVGTRGREETRILTRERGR